MKVLLVGDFGKEWNFETKFESKMDKKNRFLKDNKVKPSFFKVFKKSKQSLQKHEKRSWIEHFFLFPK